VLIKQRGDWLRGYTRKVEPDVRSSSSMMPEFDGYWRQPQRGSHTRVNISRKGDFLGPVHLGFDHIDRARDLEIAHPPFFYKMCIASKCCDHRVQSGFADLQPVAVQKWRGGQLR